MSRAWIIVALIAAGGCNEGNELTNAIDLSTADSGGDGSTGAIDLSAPDLMGKTCGQIVSCAVQCGLTNLTCDQGCVTGASPTAIQQAGALTLCAAQNCLLTGDGGVAGMAGIFQCLLGSCGTQVSMCDGLFALPM